MKFISAGHHNDDPGAVSKYGKEANWTKKVKDRVVSIIRGKTGEKVITDNDNETLSQYLRRIKPGSGSVVVEFHFDAFNGKAHGTTALIENEADRLDYAFAKEMVDATAQILGIPNRGVKKERESHRGRLGLMREEGLICLLEVCFIDNPQDMTAIQSPYKFDKLCEKYADIIIKYDKLLQ